MPVFHAAHVCSPAMRDLSQMFNSLIEHLDQFIVFRRGWPLLMMSSLMSLVDHSVSTNPRLSFASGIVNAKVSIVSSTRALNGLF